MAVKIVMMSMKLVTEITPIGEETSVYVKGVIMGRVIYSEVV